MSYRLINANALAANCKQVNDMPCIYADLPNGLDGGHYDMTERESCRQVPEQVKREDGRERESYGKRTRDSINDLMARKDGGKSRYTALFGTPERAAQYLAMQCFGSDGSMCHYCPFDDCDEKLRNSGAYPTVYDALLEWLRGDAE